MAKSYEPWKAWLVFNRQGVQRLTKLPPSLASGEYAVEVHVEIPREFFLRPVPRVRVELPTDMRLQPKLAVDWHGEALAAAQPDHLESGAN